jgi:hypothetical protein
MNIDFHNKNLIAITLWVIAFFVGKVVRIIYNLIRLKNASKKN